MHTVSLKIILFSCVHFVFFFLSKHKWDASIVLKWKITRRKRRRERKKNNQFEVSYMLAIYQKDPIDLNQKNKYYSIAFINKMIWHERNESFVFQFLWFQCIFDFHLPLLIFEMTFRYGGDFDRLLLHGTQISWLNVNFPWDRQRQIKRNTAISRCGREKQRENKIKMNEKKEKKIQRRRRMTTNIVQQQRIELHEQWT